MAGRALRNGGELERGARRGELRCNGGARQRWRAGELGHGGVRVIAGAAAADRRARGCDGGRRARGWTVACMRALLATDFVLKKRFCLSKMLLSPSLLIVILALNAGIKKK